MTYQEILKAITKCATVYVGSKLTYDDKYSFKISKTEARAAVELRHSSDPDAEFNAAYYVNTKTLWIG